LKQNEIYKKCKKTGGMGDLFLGYGSYSKGGINSLKGEKGSGQTSLFWFPTDYKED